MLHRWQFFRAGGVDQVSLRDGFDLLALPDLDPKLWIALAMPTTDVDLDPATLALLDADKDGRVRIDDVRAAIAEIKQWFRDPGELLTSRDGVELAQIADAKVLAAARRVLADLGKPEATTITVADTIAVTQAFENTVLNGDGIVIPASAGDDAATRAAIEDVIACTGGVRDRSGKPGVDRARGDAFFADLDAQLAWLAARPGELDRAADALAAIHAKLDDYFTRCRLAAFDRRAAAALAGQEADLVALSGKLLAAGDDAIAKLPLAAIDPAARLPLAAGVNPAWAERLAAFVEHAVTPVLGARDTLSPADLAELDGKLAAFVAWRAARPAGQLGALAPARLSELAPPEVRAKIHALIAADAALAGDYDQLTAVAKIVRYQRDFGRLVRNFVNFADFYGKQQGAFQAGTLYLDGRALHLCIPVADAGKHAGLATSSDACLLYCELARGATKRQIVAALTNGDADNVFVGRNGVFYDRDGHDWDATITRIVANPISVREAFWAPYKRLVKAIEDNVTKRAQTAQAATDAKLDAFAHDAAHGDQIAHAAGSAAVAAPEAPKRIDLGTIAAIGVAIGGIGTLVGALLATMFGLGRWLPLGVVALLLLISGPSMLLAWLKLRRRNLGPILDANGWAINTRARINVSFGAAMTELAKIPPGSQRLLSDPFADKTRPWKLYIAAATLVVLGGTWYIGRLDSYLPVSVRSTTVLGESAPAYHPAPPPAAAAPTPR